MKSNPARLLVLGAVAILMLSASTCQTGSPPPDTSQPANSWNISWYQYNTKSIRESNGKYTAGKIKDFVELDANSALLASPFSGLWWVTQSSGVQVGKEWEHPGMRCVEKVSNTRYYAGGERNDSAVLGALYVSDVSASAPIVARWHPIPLQGAGVGVINDIVFVPELNILVLATDNGIWYSNVPAAAGANGYAFRQARMPAGAGNAFENLCRTTNNILLASQSYKNRSNSLAGIYNIILTPDQDFDAIADPVLVFQASVINNINISSTTTVYLGVCKNFPLNVYALAGSNREMQDIFRSLDGGLTFNKRNAQFVDGGNITSAINYPIWGGRSMDWSGAMAVHPNDSQKISIAAANGPFISIDGGRNFKTLPNSGIHQDYGMMKFSDFVNDRLICATDGGITFTNGDLAAALNNGVPVEMNNNFNQHLPNLLFYSGVGRRMAHGSMSAWGGMLSGGLQDNDNIMMKGANQPWTFCAGAGADGGATGFTEFGYLCNDNNAAIEFIPYNYGTSTAGAAATVNISSAAPGTTSTTLTGPFFTIPNSTVVDASRRRLVALSANKDATGTSTAVNNIYGIYATGTSATAAYLFTVPFAAGEIVSSIFSPDGRKILIGTRGGARIFVARNVNGTYSVPSSSGRDMATFRNEIGKITPAGSDQYFAMQNTWDSSDVLISNGGNVWLSVKGNLKRASVFSIAVDTVANPKRYFVAMDDGVYGTNALNGSSTQWIKVSTGLPTIPHSSDLMVGMDFNNRRTLFLSTWGSSVWAARLDP